MNLITEKIITDHPSGLFTETDVKNYISGTPDGRRSLLKRAMGQQEVWRIKRGLYCLAPRYQKQPVHPFGAAQLIYGPSYIGLESALSFHGWIPEGVYATTSVSFKKSKSFTTPLGSFLYQRVPQRTFFQSVKRVTDGPYVFLVATPLKAVADYVYVHKKDWRGFEPLAESLRVDPEQFQELTKAETADLTQNYSSRRVRAFLHSLLREMQQ